MEELRSPARGRQPPPPRRSGPAEWALALADARGGSLSADEGDALVPAAGAFFCLLVAYFLLLPLRDTVGVALGTSVLPALFAGSLALTAVVAPLAAAFLRRRGAAALLRLQAAAVLGFLAAFAAAGAPTAAPLRPSAKVGAAAFYLFVSLLNIVSVSALWTTCAEAFSPRAAKAAFGLLGAGATAGQLTGSLVASALARRREPWALLALLPAAAAALAASGACIQRLGALRLRRAGGGGETPPRRRPDLAKRSPLRGASPGRSPLQQLAARSPAVAAAAAAAARPLAGLADALAAIWRSPYLLHICAYLVFHYIVSSLFYFTKVQVQAARAAAGDDAGGSAAAFFAAVNAASAVGLLALQLGATGRALRALGLARALAALPLTGAAAMAAVAARPTRGAVAAAEVARKLVTYSLARPAREVLFTVLSREEAAAGAKMVMDTTLQRLGDAAAAAAFAVLVPWAGLGTAGVAAAAVPVCAAWAALAAALGARHEALAAAGAGPGSPAGRGGSPALGRRSTGEPPSSENL